MRSIAVLGAIIAVHRVSPRVARLCSSTHHPRSASIRKMMISGQEPHGPEHEDTITLISIVLVR